MAKLNRSRSWKPRPRLPSNRRAAIASMGRRSSIRIGIPVASSPSSGTQLTSSLASNIVATLNTDQVGNFKYVWLALSVHRQGSSRSTFFLPGGDCERICGGPARVPRCGVCPRMGRPLCPEPTADCSVRNTTLQADNRPKQRTVLVLTRSMDVSITISDAKIRPAR